ncbi:MAG: sulfur oxidation c-type cytochrome SoxX [Aestuariivirgaceae bacterium]
MKSTDSRIAFFAGLAFLASAASASAGAIAPDQVKFDELEVKTALTDTPGNAQDGKKWFANRKLGNCLACHVNKDLASQPFHGEVGPAMDGAGSRYSVSQLRGILIDSKAVFGGETIMPGFYRVDPGARTAKKFQGKTILSGQQIEDIIAYVMTLKEE